jgi:hypothetical protein
MSRAFDTCVSIRCSAARARDVLEDISILARNAGLHCMQLNGGDRQVLASLTRLIADQSREIDPIVFGFEELCSRLAATTSTCCGSVRIHSQFVSSILCCCTPTDDPAHRISSKQLDELSFTTLEELDQLAQHAELGSIEGLQGEGLRLILEHCERNIQRIEDYLQTCHTAADEAHTATTLMGRASMTIHYLAGRLATKAQLCGVGGERFVEISGDLYKGVRRLNGELDELKRVITRGRGQWTLSSGSARVA